MLQVRFGHVEKWESVGDWTLALHGEDMRGLLLPFKVVCKMVNN